MNALLHELLERGWYDRAYVEAHTIGFDELQRVVERCTAGAGRRDLRRPGRRHRARRRDPRHVASGCCRRCCRASTSRTRRPRRPAQVNNLHLLRGMIGRPGAGLYQMNGQPTAQNTRETGADGDLPGLRNWDNPAHIAASWPTCGTSTRSPSRTGRRRPTPCRSSATPSRGRSSCCGSRRPTRPSRCRSWPASVASSSRTELFVVVQDLFLTETAELADVVLPAATWGEKIGTFTNVDRTVHLSEQAVDPPGEARADLDIFLDYARRMDFRDRDGGPLITWHDAESAFEAWKALLRGPALRLHRPHLRPAPPAQRHPVALHRRGARRHRAALHRRALQHRPRLLRDLRPRPRPPARRGPSSEYRAKEPHGRAFLARRRLRAAAGGADRRATRCC